MKTFGISEPFLEATPQVHMTLILIGQFVLHQSPILYISFATSIVSAAFGIAKLLKNGPIKLIRKDGKIGGYGQPGFILAMLIVAGNMIGKATWMAFGFDRSKTSLIWIWVLACILPQVLLVNLITYLYE